MIDKNTYDKEWGRDHFIFGTDNVSIRRLEINEGGKSTKGNFHLHRNKYNRFFVETGLLKVFIKTATGIKENIIGDEQEFRKIDVWPNIPHRFECLKEAIVYEIYWAYCDSKDIVRFDENFQKIAI